MAITDLLLEHLLITSVLVLIIVFTVLTIAMMIVFTVLMIVFSSGSSIASAAQETENWIRKIRNRTTM